MNIRKMNILIASALCFSMLTLTGCGNKDADDTEPAKSAQTEELDTETKEIRQNDYRGGVVRTYALQSAVLDVMENMKANNIVIRSDNPNSFWQNNGYQDFVVNFLNAAIINDTKWFNEEETEWSAVLSQMVNTPNSFTVVSSDSTSGYVSKYSGLNITRNEKDDYTIDGFTSGLDNSGLYSGNVSYRILYDCDKDWCKAYATITMSNDLPSITTDLFEYARLDSNTFVIQTSNERLYVVLDNAEFDTDLRERTIKEFYYSKLTAEGARTTFTPFQPLPEYDLDTSGYISENSKINERMLMYPKMNEHGDLTTRYGLNDSIFLTDDIISDISKEWTFEDKSLQQAIVYSKGALVVTTYNKLSEKYERFIYSTEGVGNDTISKLEDMVEIKDLVGIQNVSETVVTETLPPTEEIETTEMLTTDTTDTSETENSEANEDTTQGSDTTEQTETRSESDEERDLMNGLEDGDTIVVDEAGNVVDVRNEE